ncbi:MAG: RelA/SpoT domain-containing protein, partial [Beijerinckiaceae bacterium]
QMPAPSKSKIDKAGHFLASKSEINTEQELDLEIIFDDYRKAHLQPLTEITLEIQKWLSDFGSDYYIAQRLKRKPQIARKLRRLSVRLTQLQDIGGCRIIVDGNKDVDALLDYIDRRLVDNKSIKVIRRTDYRDLGRDDTGYRSFHYILSKSGLSIELQIRSKIQHYWSESIERTSVIYGYHLKEKEGDQYVIDYFKILSNIFYEIESGRQISTQDKIELSASRARSESIIQKNVNTKVLGSHINEDIVKTLAQIEKNNPNDINNWIFVFDWNIGNFITWDVVSRDPEQAVREYIKFENNFPASKNYEVVMIGSSNVSTIRYTHSHYFGIDTNTTALESLESSIIGFSQKMDLDVGAREILSTLVRKKYWGSKTMLRNTLKNHYCKDVITFESSLHALIKKGFVIDRRASDLISLNRKFNTEILKYL